MLLKVMPPHEERKKEKEKKLRFFAARVGIFMGARQWGGSSSSSQDQLTKQERFTFYELASVLGIIRTRQTRQ